MGRGWGGVASGFSALRATREIGSEPAKLPGPTEPAATRPGRSPVGRCEAGLFELSFHTEPGPGLLIGGECHAVDPADPGAGVGHFDPIVDLRVKDDFPRGHEIALPAGRAVGPREVFEEEVEP